jgi:hypothetical protein
MMSTLGKETEANGREYSTGEHQPRAHWEGVQWRRIPKPRQVGKHHLQGSYRPPVGGSLGWDRWLLPHPIVFYLHQVDEDRRSLLKVHPENREELPLVGVFATRSPVRPNPIGVTVVKLLECQNNVLKVLGLDAYDGSPVLDIKPYLRRGDLIEEATMPDWLLHLWELQDSGH